MATAPLKSPSRIAALEMFLEAVNARCVRTFEQKHVSSPYRLQVFIANGRVFHVVQHLSAVNGVPIGFDVFVPSSSENDVAATLGAARNFIVRGHVAPFAMDACNELIRGDGTPDSQQRAIDHARLALGLPS